LAERVKWCSALVTETNDIDLLLPGKESGGIDRVAIEEGSIDERILDDFTADE
jgi:hypothetical protein